MSSSSTATAGMDGFEALAEALQADEEQEQEQEHKHGQGQTGPGMARVTSSASDVMRVVGASHEPQKTERALGRE